MQGAERGSAELSEVWIKAFTPIEFKMTVFAREFACIGHLD